MMPMLTQNRFAQPTVTLSSIRVIITHLKIAYQNIPLRAVMRLKHQLNMTGAMEIIILCIGAFGSVLEMIGYSITSYQLSQDADDCLPKN
jgi:hypothetical protein